MYRPTIPNLLNVFSTIENIDSLVKGKRGTSPPLLFEKKVVESCFLLSPRETTRQVRQLKGRESWFQNSRGCNPRGRQYGQAKMHYLPFGHSQGGVCRTKKQISDVTKILERLTKLRRISFSVELLVLTNGTARQDSSL